MKKENEVFEKLKKIGLKIRSRRQEKELSLRELGRLCGVSASFIGAVENGKNVPSMVKLKEIADILGLTLTYLLDEETTKENTKILLQNISKDTFLYKEFLQKHTFPNGLTYLQMESKLKKLEKLEQIIKD